MNHIPLTPPTTSSGTRLTGEKDHRHPNRWLCVSGPWEGRQVILKCLIVRQIWKVNEGRISCIMVHYWIQLEKQEIKSVISVWNPGSSAYHTCTHTLCVTETHKHFWEVFHRSEGQLWKTRTWVQRSHELWPRASRMLIDVYVCVSVIKGVVRAALKHVPL